MKEDEVAKKFYLQLKRDIPKLSDFANVLFHPQHFAPFIPYIYRKINASIQSYSLKFDEVDWDHLYPFLRDYAKETHPVHGRDKPLETLQHAQLDLLHYLGTYFRDVQLRTEHRYRMYLSAQAGSWAYKATMPIAPKYPMERPMDEATVGAKLLSQEHANKGVEDYYVNQSPYVDAYGAKADKTVEYMDNFIQNGGWGV